MFEYRLVDGLWREGAELTVASEAEALFGATIVLNEGRAVLGAPLSRLGSLTPAHSHSSLPSVDSSPITL